MALLECNQQNPDNIKQYLFNLFIYYLFKIIYCKGWKRVKEGVYRLERPVAMHGFYLNSDVNKHTIKKLMRRNNFETIGEVWTLDIWWHKGLIF